jgi:hypothetical protein
MKVTWRQLFGLSVAMLLRGSGVWANVGNGSLPKHRRMDLAQSLNRSTRLTATINVLSSF